MIQNVHTGSCHMMYNGSENIQSGLVKEFCTNPVHLDCFTDLVKRQYLQQCILLNCGAV